MSGSFRRRPLVIAFLATACWSAAGCQRPGGPASSAALSEEKRRALLPLEHIEPDVALPPPPSAAPAAPLPEARRHLRQAQARFAERLWADAVDHLEKALSVDPSDADAAILLARAAMQLGSLSLAEKRLSAALARRPRDPAIYQLLGEIAWQQNRTRDAIRFLRLALLAGADDPLRPECVLAHLSLAMALRKDGYLLAAAGELEAYLSAVARPTAAMTGHLELGEIITLYRGKAAALLGEICEQLDRHEAAAKAYRRALDEAPGDASLRPRLAVSLARCGRDEEALGVVREMLDDGADLARASALLAEVCELLGRPERYDDELVALAAAAKDSAARLELIRLLIERKRPARALPLLEDFVRGHPDDADAAFQLAELMLGEGRTADALALLAAALRKHPAGYVRVDALLSRSGAADLLERARSGSASAPEDRVVRYLHGLLLMKQRRWSEAEKEIEAAASSEKGFAPAWAALARIHIEQKRWEEVLAATDKAVAGGLQTADVHLLRGIAQEALDEFDAAEASWMDAFRQDPRSAEPLYRLARTEERRGRVRRAEQLYRRILDDVDPRHTAARERLVRLYLESGQFKQARDYYSDFLRLEQSGPHVDRCRALLTLMTGNRVVSAESLSAYREELEQSLERYPHDPATHIDIAWSHLRVGQFARAAAPVDSALAIDGDDLFALDLKASLLARDLKFGEALQVIRRIVALRPRDVVYQRRLIESALNDDNFDAALDGLRALARRSDRKELRPWVYRNLVEVLRLLGRTGEALNTAKAWLDEEPADSARRELYLAALHNAGRHEQAVDVAKKWLADDPTSAELRAIYIDQLREAGRVAEAQLKVLSWLAGDPDDVDLNRILIVLCWVARQWDAAIEQAAVGAESSQNKAVFQNLLGLSYMRARRYDEAIRFYRDRFKTTARMEAFRDMVAVLTDARRFDEAEQAVQNALQPQLLRQGAGEPVDLPDLVELRRMLVRIYQLSDRAARAREQMEEIFKLAPADPRINNDLGYTLADAGEEIDRAEEMIRQAVAERPREPAYLDSLGWVLYKRGRFEEALTYLRRALRLSERKDAVMYDHVGDVLYRLGRREEARSHWDQAVKVLESQRDEGATPEELLVLARARAKLAQLEKGETVEAAPLAGTASGPSSRPADVP